MTTNYTSIKSVLYGLSLMIDDRYWNETKMLEWIAHGLRTINITSGLEDKVKLLEVVSHKAALPSDFKYLTQIAYYTPARDMATESVYLDAPDNYDVLSDTPTSSLKWKAMRLTSSPYHNSICLDSSIINCAACEHTFSISTSGVITTTLTDGIIMVAYKGYPVDSDGDLLMPDDETLKEALMHYALYMYWMSKFQMKESGAEDRLRFHLTQWSTLSKKAMRLNNPDVSELENLKQINNKLIPRTNRYQQMFLSLTNRENANF